MMVNADFVVVWRAVHESTRRAKRRNSAGVAISTAFLTNHALTYHLGQGLSPITQASARSHHDRGPGCSAQAG
jgi:hypothetical protein